MGWRDRDYAKWTPEERRRFLGSSAPATRGASASHAGSRRTRINQGAGLAIVVTGALLLLGQVPRGHPILQALHFTLPSLHHSSPVRPGASFSVAKPRVTKLSGPRTATVDSSLTFNGSAPTAGTVTVEGSYNGGRAWKILAVAPAPDRSYSARITLSRRGLLHLRVLYPDGSRAAGSIRVH